MDTIEIKGLVQDTKNRTEIGQDGPTVRSDDKRKTLPKNHQDRWAAKLKKRSYRDSSGELVEIPEWQVRMFHLRREGWFNLGTANKATATAKAREIHECLRANGWEATLAKFKPERANQPRDVGTVGDFLEEVKAKAGGRARTVANYCKALRTIVAGAFGIDGGNSKYDYRTGGRDKWLLQIHAVKLASVTADRVRKWKKDFTDRAGDDPVKQRTAKISVNSTMRQAKCLFAPDMLEAVQIKLSAPSPFDGVKFEDGQSMKYRSGFDVQDVIRLALNGDEAKKIAPLPNEQKKIFLLAVMAGFRRNEIDKLEWNAFRWDQALIRIENTRFLHLKSEDSAGDAPLDPELLAIFKEYHAESKSNFVIESKVQPRLGTDYNHYRCQRELTELTRWLRVAGVVGNRPLHQLRKEFGSQLCAKFGIYAASRALRHGDIAITAQHYLDARQRVTVGLGHLLTEEQP